MAQEVNEWLLLGHDFALNIGKWQDFIMVPELGIEPRCPCERGILSPLRLPVSPLRHGQRLYRWGIKSQAKNC